MKLVLISFFVFVFIVCRPSFSEVVFKTYDVKVSGIKIGKLYWNIEMNNEKYHNNLKLESRGLLSAIYNFNGEYLSEGTIINKQLKPIKYTHLWQTKKTKKDMVLFFKKNKLISINQKPIEKESIKVDVFSIEGLKDPLTSFLEIILGEKSSLVVDGRRLYTMLAIYNKDKNQKIIKVEDYSNLWAEHKRKKFEKIIFEKGDEELLPTKMFIYFDGRVFRLE